MRKYFNTLMFTLFLCFFGNAQNVIETNLQEVMNRESDDMISINIIMKSQAQPSDIRGFAGSTSDREARKDLMIKGLKKHSSKNQADVLRILEDGRRNNNVSDISAHWLVNTISCKATQDVINILAKHPDISHIRYNESKNVIGDIKAERVVSTENVASHIKAVKADKVWSMGYTGKDVVVAVLDSGTNFDHADIDSDNLWDGGSEHPYHGYNVIEPNMMPYDDNGHGSHCAGIICGTGASGTATGIAPDATLMTVKVTDSEGNTTLEYLTSGIEFAVENGADVMSISLGWQNPDVSVSTVFRNIFENTLELGILSSVAAGNDRDELLFYPIPKNINAPGNCPPAWLHPDQMVNAGGLSGVICVGAVGDDYASAEFSSQGPVTWQYTEWDDYPYEPGIGLIRPDISAPGVNVLSLSHIQYDGYLRFSGTSMATPCVAGVIALMLEKNPDLTPSDICRLIETTAVKLLDKKSNNIGSGVVDALAAINEGKDIPYLNFATCSPEVIMSGDNRDFTIKLVNNGSASTTGTTNVILSTEDEYVTILDNSATFGMMEPKDIASGVFKINIDNNAPIGHIIKFQLEISCDYDDNTLRFSDSFSIEINNRPYIRYQSCTPSVLANTVNEIVIDMFNNGNVATTDNSIVTLSTKDQYLTIVDNEAIFSPMAPDESSSGTFSIMASPITPEGHIFDLKLNTILANNYEKSSVIYNFEDMTMMGWTSIDADGDGYEWFNSNTLLGANYQGHESMFCMFSESFTNSIYEALSPDNYLVSPMKFEVKEDTEFSFWACGQDNNYPEEHFGVAVSTTGNSAASDFTTIAEWTIENRTRDVAKKDRGNSRTQTAWRKYTVDLSGYAGQEIWVAIRHFNCYDQYMLSIDDITISNIDVPISWEESFNLKFESHSADIRLDSFSPDMLESGTNEVIITMVNNGPVATTDDIAVVLTAESQYITIEENKLIYPSLGVGEKATKSYTVNIASTAPNGQKANFNVYASPVNNQETDIAFSFDNDMSRWTTINSNNDDHTWYHSSDYDIHDIVPIPSHSGNGHIMSESYCNNTLAPIVPDDYVVSPTMIEATENTTVSFWACAQDEDSPAEHIGVAVSTKGNTSATDFTTIAEWTMTAKSGHAQRERSTNGTRYGQWHQFTVDLSEYAGQKLWVAIRHFDTNNQFSINVDDIEFKNFLTVYEWSSDFSVTILNDNIAPANLKATAIDVSSVRLEWDGPEDAVSYKIYRDDEYLTNVTTTDYIDDNLEENTEYCYSVTCIIGEEESLHSNTACVTTKAECMTPENIAYTVEENTSDFKYLITMTWDEVAGASSYSIYTTNSFLANVNEPMFVTGAQSDGVYVYRIMSNCGENGSSELSEEIVIVLQSEECLAPTNIAATVEENAPDYNYVFKVTLTWDAVANARSYNVYIDDELFEENLTGNSVVVGDDVEGTRHIRVSSICDNGESELSEVLEVDLKHTGVDEQYHDLRIFPNPVNDKLYVYCQDDIEEISIFNVTGVNVYQTSGSESNEIDMSEFSQGIYIIKIRTERHNIVKQIIKK